MRPEGWRVVRRQTGGEKKHFMEERIYAKSWARKKLDVFKAPKGWQWEMTETADPGEVGAGQIMLSSMSLKFFFSKVKWIATEEFKQGSDMILSTF